MTETTTPLTACQEARAAKAEANKSRATAHFMKEISDIEAMAARITAHAEDHLGYDADEITWAHQVTAASIRAKLAEVLAFIEQTEE